MKFFAARALLPASQPAATLFYKIKKGNHDISYIEYFSLYNEDDDEEMVGDSI